MKGANVVRCPEQRSSEARSSLSTLTTTRPLLVIHHLGGAIFTTTCGRVAGGRRFDVELGVTVRDTAWLPDVELKPFPGAVVCAACSSLSALSALS